MIVQPPASLLPSEAQNGPVPLKYLLVDTGLEPRQLKDRVRVGDLISFAQPPVEIKGEYLFGHSLDNRASVAASVLARAGRPVINVLGGMAAWREAGLPIER